MRTRGRFGKALLADDADTVAHALDGGRHDFWSLVDSTPSASARYACRCKDVTLPAEDDCCDWSHIRNGEWCIAANSNAGRCSQRAEEPTPFCEFHLERAWEVLQVAALQRADLSFFYRLESRKRDEEAKTQALVTQGRLERALGFDAATAVITERVYFFVADHAVKIGRSLRPERRVKTLGGTKAPDDVAVSTGNLLGTIVGGCSVESELHQRFHQHRLVGEWFTYAPIAGDIAALIAECAASESAA